MSVGVKAEVSDVLGRALVPMYGIVTRRWR